MDLPTWLSLLDHLYPDTVPEKYCRACGWHGTTQELYCQQGCPRCRSFAADYNNRTDPA